MKLFRRTSDADLAATKYEGCESATDKAARGRREGHRRHVPDAAAKGQAWEDKDRAAERRGRDRVTDWDSE
ncbi:MULTISPECIES: hypothetical protein [unclassified Streptomyces]|uniref:hypothetical protein n=1 Tax=unclassified Streptomyces TaxID=2593676 RepID=UPI002E177D66|nr:MULTISPECIES: hypothetical protein [unclassified Streptomyces]